MSAPEAPQPEPPSRGGSHRAPATPTTVARNLAGPLIAVVAVAIVVVLLLFLNGRPAKRGGSPAVEPPASVSHSASVSPSATKATTSPTAKPSTLAATPSSARAVARLPVTVLNNSRYAGLAAKAAAQLRAGGWPVAAVGNFTGRIAEPTVYYAPGEEAAAKALAAQFPRIARVHPRFPGLPGTGLTLVVTRQWDP